MVWLNAIITLVVYKNSLKMNELLIISFELCMLIVWARLWLHQFPRNWIGLHGWIKLNSIECSTVSVCIHFYHFLPVFLLFWCYFCSFFLKILFYPLFHFYPFSYCKHGLRIEETKLKPRITDTHALTHKDERSKENNWTLSSQHTMQ